MNRGKFAGFPGSQGNNFNQEEEDQHLEEGEDFIWIQCLPVKDLDVEDSVNWKKYRTYLS